MAWLDNGDSSQTELKQFLSSGNGIATFMVLCLRVLMRACRNTLSMLASFYFCPLIPPLFSRPLPQSLCNDLISSTLPVASKEECKDCINKHEFDAFYCFCVMNITCDE